MMTVQIIAALKTSNWQTSFLSWKAKIDQMEKKCRELNPTFIDEYVIEAKQLMSHLNPDANVGQGQFYCHYLWLSLQLLPSLWRVIIA